MSELDWRGLFDALRVPWRDRGSNTSTGNVNICCPWCHGDTGYHLSVNEEGKGYYCYRMPGRHSGTNTLRLLSALNASRSDAIRLLNQFNLTKSRLDSIAAEAAEPGKPKIDPSALWQNFKPASSSQRAMDYLYDRGFGDPEWVADYYDLRISLMGKWGGRIILPIKQDARVVSWTARDFTGNQIPKYKALKDAESSLLYVPDPVPLMRPGCTLAVVEGPIDALKIAWAMHGEPIGSAALTGKNFGSAKVLQLRALAANAGRKLLSLDNDAGVLEPFDIIATMRAAQVQFERKPIPSDFKDPGEMSRSDIRMWLA